MGNVQSKMLEEAYNKMSMMRTRSLEAQLFNKANELQEDISLKRFDQRVAHLHLAAIRAQKEMFASKVDSGGAAPPPPPPLGGSYSSGSNRDSGVVHRETTGNGSSSLQEPL